MSRPSVARLLLIVLISVASLLRFVHVSQIPPGFYIDEAAISAQVICVRESGANLQGHRLPLLTEVLGGGYVTPSYLYPAVAWTSVFGDSVQSFRSFTAFFSILFIIGAFVFGRRFWRSDDAGWLCASSAALSPWVFQFARIAWDPSLAPAYMIWAFALLWPRAPESRTWQASPNHISRISELAGSGLLFALAAYCYPPLRVQLAIMLPFAILALVFIFKCDWKPFAITVVTGFAAALPLIRLTLTGEIQARFAALSVFNRDFLLRNHGSATWLDGANEVFHNFGLLLSPAYLFVHGDANLRHSTSFFGVFSWLDILGLLAGLVAFAVILRGRSKIKFAAFEISFVVIGYLAGLLPAALTWESNPHALRSFGAVVFLVLGVGGGLFHLWHHSRAMRSAVIGMAFVSFLLFVHVYFTEYPRLAQGWFDAPVVELARDLSRENKILQLSEALQARGISYAPMAVEYYQLADGALRCPLISESSTR